MKNILWSLLALLLGSGCRSLRLTGDAQEELRREIAPVVEPGGRLFQARGRISRFGYSVPLVCVVRLSEPDRAFAAAGMLPVGAALFQITGSAPAALETTFSPLVPMLAREHLLFCIQEDLYNIYAPPQNYHDLTVNEKGVVTFQEQRNDGQKVEWTISAPPRRLLAKTCSHALNLTSWRIDYQQDGHVHSSRPARWLHLHMSPIEKH
ncbi:MAG: hypothetical protein IJJ33_17430 [Victivallales bacterium]|nr:hypothetical protein [Victivallales bacterium]